MLTRRNLLSRIAAAVTTAGLPRLLEAQNGNRQNACQAPQHFRQTSTTYAFNACANEYVRLTIDVRQTVQACPNSDGSTSYRVQTKIHGSGYGIDLFTESPTGTNYIINTQDKIRVVTGPISGGECVPFSQVERYRERLISKGGSPNSFIVVHNTLSLDSSCHLSVNSQVEFDCKG